MTVYKGDNGTVEVDAAVVAQVKSFSVNEDAEALNTTVLGATGHTYTGGLGKSTGTIECLYDHGDATGQEALTVGASVTLTIYPIDDASGYREATIAAVVTGIGIESNYDELLGRTFNFTGGAITWATVP